MKKTLIVVDMQNDFVDGVLGTKRACEIVPRVRQKIDEYIARGDEVFFTRDTHYDNYFETNEGRCLPIAHCIAGTQGWQIVDALKIDNGRYIDKPTFGWVHWSDYNFEDIEIIGVCTDICVISNAMILKAFFPEVNITVDASCCAGVTPESHKAALMSMKMCQINVIGE